MKRYAKSLIAMSLIGLLTACGEAPAEKASDAKAEPVIDTSYYFGARIIPGDGSPAMEDMSIVVSKGKIVTIGKRSEVAPTKGSNRVDLTGRTVVPGLINLQTQPGMNTGAQYGPKNYTRDSMTADLSRYAYYGIVAVLSAGTDSGDLAFSVRDELLQGKIKGARLLTARPGYCSEGWRSGGIVQRHYRSGQCG